MARSAGYRLCMTWWQATLWGLAGGGAASLLSFMTAVVSSGYSWPEDQKVGPRLFVVAAGAVLGAMVAAAAHDQISGPWPAFIFGVGAPATIRGLLSGVEVVARADTEPITNPHQSAHSLPHPGPGPEELREDAS
jgi:zinc transporter ZupT